MSDMLTAVVFVSIKKSVYVLSAVILAVFLWGYAVFFVKAS